MIGIIDSQGIFVSLPFQIVLDRNVKRKHHPKAQSVSNSNPLQKKSVRFVNRFPN